MRRLTVSLRVAKQSVYFIWTMACQCAAFCRDPKSAVGVTQVFRFEGG